MMSTSPYEFLLQLLFDRAVRARFEGAPGEVLLSAGLDPEAASAFLAIDKGGLALDAEQRERYLMSALCRAYPLTSGALGALADGKAHLADFLARGAHLGTLQDRTLAFGAYLGDLLKGLSDPETADFLQAFHSLELGLVQSAARVRQAVAQGAAAPTAPTNPPNLPRGRVTLAPHLVALQLPTSPEVLRTALGHLTAGDAWHRIEGGGLSWGRVVTVARAEPTPVTVLARAVVRGQSAQRGGGGSVAPLI